MRISTFLLAIALPAAALAQGSRAPVSPIPPGANYDPAKHINPVITYVQSKDFQPSTMKDAEGATDIQLLGLSKEVGTIQSIDLAKPSADMSKELKMDIRGTFYAVVRQTFKLSDGGELILCSLKPPRIQSMGSYGQPRMSTGLPFPTGGKNAKDKDKRFGAVSPPEELEVRGLRGLIFDQENSITIAWVEDGVIHTATSSLSRRAMYRVLDDLL